MEEQRGDWVKCRQVNSDNEETEPYYYNVVTQETQWEPPEEFRDTDAPVDLMSSVSKPVEKEYKDLHEFMKEIGLDKQEHVKPNSVQLLYEGCEKYCSDHYWIEFMKEKNFQLIKILLSVFLSTKSIDEKLAVFKVFFFLAQLDSELLGLFKYEQIIQLKDLYKLVGIALTSNKNDDLLPMLLFLEAIFSYDMENTIKFFPNTLFMKVLFDYIQEKEEVYVNVVLSICIDISYYCTKFDKNPFLNFIYDNNRHDLPVLLITLLNSLGTPVRNPQQLKVLLVCLTEFFGNTKNHHIFYTNDIHLLMDIILREVTNLPREDIVCDDYADDDLHRVVRITSIS